MKKPVIEVRHVKGFENMPMHFFVNDRALTLDQIEARYSEMIDALVEARKELLDLGLSHSNSIIENATQALKKAGCTD